MTRRALTLALVGVGLTATACATTAPGRSRNQSSEVRVIDLSLSRKWREIDVRRDNIRTLIGETARRGETGARVLMSAVAASTLDADVRLHALWGLETFWGRWPGCDDRFPYDGAPPDIGLRACRVLPPDVGVPAPEIVMVTIAPALRDTIRIALATMPRGRDRVSEAIAQHLARISTTERWSAEVRESCRRYRRARAVALQTFPRGLAVHGPETAVLARCTETGPEILAELWRMVPDDTTSLRALVTTTVGIRDRRSYDALLSTAADGNRPAAVRTAAMRALGAMIHEGVVGPTLRRSRAFNLTIPLDCAIVDGLVDHLAQEEGSRPLDAGAARRGLEALRDLGLRAQSATLRDAANAVADCVENVSALVRKTVEGQAAAASAATGR